MICLPYHIKKNPFGNWSIYRADGSYAPFGRKREAVLVMQWFLCGDSKESLYEWVV